MKGQCLCSGVLVAKYSVVEHMEEMEKSLLENSRQALWVVFRCGRLPAECVELVEDLPLANESCVLACGQRGVFFVQMSGSTY